MSVNALRSNPQDPVRGHSTAPNSGTVEARRREIQNLLEEIRSDRPSRAEVVAAIRRGSNGELTPDHLQQIAGSVLALYR